MKFKIRLFVRLSAILITVALASPEFLAAKPRGESKRHVPTKKSHAPADAGLRILRLSGTPRERGITQGKRFAREIITLLDAFIRAERLSGGPRGYEAALDRVNRTMKIQPIYRDELEGIVEGMRAVAREDLVIPSIRRDLRLDDLIAMNAIADSAAFGCSSFGAWGPMTKRGDTIVARNLDWFYIPELAANQVVIVREPDPANRRAGWVSISWPGQIGCFTGMNDEGVTVCMHDVDGGRPEQPSGFTPRSLILRETIEKARADTARRDILQVLRDHTVAVGNNIPVGLPYRESSKSPPFMVFEYDGRKSRSGGVQLNEGEQLKRAGNAIAGAGAGADRACNVCTNHYVIRAAPQKCRRYEKLFEALSHHSDEGRPIDAVDAGRILARASVTPTKKIEGILTYHSVVFEPNRRTLRVAFSRNGKPATDFEWKSLSVDTLLHHGDKTPTGLRHSAP